MPSDSWAVSQSPRDLVSPTARLEGRPMKKILIVDDSSTLLMVERTLLHQGSYSVTAARDGAEALWLVQTERPDLILMDIVMPRVDGYEACRRLRGAPETRNIPIIMVTTRGEPESIDLAFGVGASDYITKPFTGPELLAKVKRQLGE
jgi:CheY-like chemotaxis protein